MIAKKCPYMKGAAVDLRCGASVTNMKPSPSEAKAYCETEEHYRCPILLARTLRESFAGLHQHA